MNVKSLAPINTAAELREKYPGQKVNTAHSCIKNTFMREYVLSEHDSTCPFCGHPIFSTEHYLLHHLSYDRNCIYPREEIAKIKMTSKTGKDHFRKVPDCEKCKSEHPEEFLACTKILVPMHYSCHTVLHKLLRGEPIPGKKYSNSGNEKQRYDWVADLKSRIDECYRTANSISEFETLLLKRGVKIMHCATSRDENGNKIPKRPSVKYALTDLSNFYNEAYTHTYDEKTGEVKIPPNLTKRVRTLGWQYEYNSLIAEFNKRNTS